MSLKNFLLNWKNKRQWNKINHRDFGISPREIIIGIARLLLLGLFIIGFSYGIKTSDKLFTLGVCISGILCVIIELH